MQSSTSSPNDVFFVPPNAFCIEIVGTDAVTVVNNLTTNDLLKLEPFQCFESFITNVRGWVVAHVTVGRLEDRILLVGSHPAPESICSHIDRYIIREDAIVTLLEDARVLLLPGAEDKLRQLVGGHNETMQPGHVLELSTEDGGGWLLSTAMAGCEHVLVSPCSEFDRLSNKLDAMGFVSGNSSSLDLLRVRHRWPLPGSEITEKTIPQELDRDALAISFTKGCYLGQETIARLDARGKLQKKLCLLSFELTGDAMPTVGAQLVVEEREVGTLTSFAANGHQGYGLAILKRGAFEVGTVVRAVVSTAEELKAVVIDPE